MKAKYVIALVGCAILTLSFTVISTTRTKEKVKTAESTSLSTPAGGMASEDPIK